MQVKTVGVVIRQRLVLRLVCPIFGLAFAFLLVGFAFDANVPGILLFGTVAVLCFVATYWSWRARIIVEPDRIRQVTLRREVVVRWADVTWVTYDLGAGNGPRLALTTDDGSIGFDQFNYPMRKVRRAIQPGLEALPDTVIVSDRFGFFTKHLEAP